MKGHMGILASFMDWLESETGVGGTLIWFRHCENCGYNSLALVVSRQRPDEVSVKCSGCGGDTQQWEAEIHPDGTIAVADERPV
jgi:hypothetical protein